MRIAPAIAALTLLFACSQEQRASDRPKDDLTVQRSGSAVHDGRVGAAAVLRTNDTEAFGPIEIALSFLDSSGDELATTRDTLPFCPADDECWWAASFFASDYGGGDVSRVRVRVAAAEPFGGGDRVQPFTVRRGDDGVIRGEAPGAQGAAYVVASVDSQPRWGTSVNLTEDTAVAVPRDLLPPLEGEELHAYFYAGRVRLGD